MKALAPTVRHISPFNLLVPVVPSTLRLWMCKRSISAVCERHGNSEQPFCFQQ
jgi:hypothetical protein